MQIAVSVLVVALPVCVSAQAIHFTNATQDIGAGFVPGVTDRMQAAQDFYDASLIEPQNFFEDLPNAPFAMAGKPGVALFDYDNDGDLDMYVTNPGGDNALFENQLDGGGGLAFVDVASAAGVAAGAHVSSGTCSGDIDNDGDRDLFVVADDGSHLLFENQGDGTFDEVSAGSGGAFGAAIPGGMSCVWGDIDNDGLLDLHVTHSWDQQTLHPCLAVPFALNQPNEMFLNNGNNTFSDVSNASGIRVLGGLPPGVQGHTWSATLADFDGDGDIDLLNTDDQCAFPAGQFGGIDRGFLQLWHNDGTGSFTNVSMQSGLVSAGEWMGVSVADFNHDGYLDFFGTNMGDYAFPTIGMPYAQGASSSRWLLGGPSGVFSDPGVGALNATTFGWSTVAEDFDNDGDTDIWYGGGINMVMAIMNDTPGNLLVNDGAANFGYEAGAGVDNLGRNPMGAAAGDLDGDGDVDLVSTSTMTLGSDLPLVPATVQYDSPFNQSAFMVPIMAPVAPFELVWTGLTPGPGDLAVELNDGNDNNWIAVNVLGTVGITDGGAVNRDGIGAVVSATPRHGETAMKPVLGGSSHLSQDSTTQNFGLGDAKRATIDVTWPGGVKNRLYNVRDGSTSTMPEIPCSYDSDMSVFQYISCVHGALSDIRDAGHISGSERAKLFASALRAYFEER